MDQRVPKRIRAAGLICREYDQTKKAGIESKSILASFSAVGRAALPLLRPDKLESQYAVRIVLMASSSLSKNDSAAR